MAVLLTIFPSYIWQICANMFKSKACSWCTDVLSSLSSKYLNSQVIWVGRTLDYFSNICVTNMCKYVQRLFQIQSWGKMCSLNHVWMFTPGLLWWFLDVIYSQGIAIFLPWIWQPVAFDTSTIFMGLWKRFSWVVSNVDNLYIWTHLIEIVLWHLCNSATFYLKVKTYIYTL